MFIDTHTHLYDEQDPALQDAMIQRAIDAGVTAMYMPNCDAETIPGMMSIATRYPDHCFPMMGLHPCYVKEAFEQELATMQALLPQHRFSAIGEIGLDYYWDKTFTAQQQIAFEQQIDWALEYELPIVIHSRESTAECIETVRKKQNGRLRGIFHCFSGTTEQAAEITELGLYLGIGGVVTYKKSTLPEVVAAMDLAHMVLETDAPYLAPVPYRGKRNESSYIPIIAAQIAAIKGMPLTEVAAITSENAKKIFNQSK
jgi:TatD DNase family protein